MKQSITIIENLTDKHIDDLAWLYNQTWFTPDRTKSDIVKMLNNSYLSLGFLDQDKLIGFCRAISDGVYKAFLFDVIVHDDYQSKGISNG